MEIDNTEIVIFYGDNTITIPKNFTFHDLKMKVLNQDKKFIKYFEYNNEKISDILLCSNYPSFITVIANSDFVEYRKGQYRCKKCRKYLNISEWKCKHSNACRAYHLLNKKDNTSISLKSGYKEIIDDDEDKDYITGMFDEEIKEKIDGIFEKNRIRMLNRINELLYG